MKMEVTRRGVYDAKGKMIEVGTVVDVKGDKVPGYLLNKATEVKSGKTAVTNPAKNPVQQTVGYAVAEKSPGWFVVTKDGAEISKSLRKSDLDGFDAMSDEDKAAFADLHKAEA